MSLDNWSAARSSEPAGAAGIARMLAAAGRNLGRAPSGAHAENRFDAAYKAILQCAMVAPARMAFAPLRANPAIIRPRCSRCH